MPIDKPGDVAQSSVADWTVVAEYAHNQFTLTTRLN